MSGGENGGLSAAGLRQPSAESRMMAIRSTEALVSGVGAVSGAENTDGWPQLRDPRLDTPHPPGLSPEILPAAVRSWIVDEAKRACVPPEFIAVPTFVGASGVVGRSVAVQPDPLNPFTIVPNLWGGVAAPPGTMKTSSLTTGLRPLHRLQLGARREFARARPQAEARIARLGIEIKAIEKRIAKYEEPVDQLEAELKNKLRERELSCLVEARYLTNDATVEKLGELLRENPMGMLLFRDELSGWLELLTRPGREGERQFYLEAWNGDGEYTFDRIGRGSVHIPALTLALLGSIQPAKLRELIRTAVSSDSGADGLLQRFQLLVWQDLPLDFAWAEQERDPALELRATEAFAFLDGIRRAGEIRQLHLRFDAAGQRVYRSWRERLEGKVRGRDVQAAPAFASHLSKYRSLMPSLAAIFHLLEAPEKSVDVIGEEPALLAVAWCEFLEGHARRLYAVELERGLDVARRLAGKIRSGEVFDGMEVREIYRKQWSGLRDSQATKLAIAVLAESSWVRTDSHGGKVVLRVHPGLRRGSS